MTVEDAAPGWSIGWRGAVGGVVCLAAAVGTGIVWTADPDPGSGVSGDGSAAVAAGAVTGEDLFHAKGCAGCHRGPDSDDDFDGPAPDLSDAPSWAGERRPGLSADEYIAESIRQPAAFISPEFRQGGAGPMEGMPNLEVSEAEIEALVAYLLHDQR